MTWNWFSYIVLCLTFFVSKSHWSVSIILSTTSIWSKTSICGWSSIHPFFIITKFLLFLTGMSGKYQICFSWRYLYEFKKKSLTWDSFSICSSNWSKMREKSFDEKRINRASATNTCFTSNWCCGQNIWHRTVKFWHKKRQT